jgi:hypothetical protein
MPDGTLLHLRDTYPIETGWAPQWTGDELRQVRAGATEARLAAIRATTEAEAAQAQGQHEKADRQQALAASYQAMHGAYAEREASFAAVMADRHDWEQATRYQRQLAVAADAELRRRHPKSSTRRCAPPNPSPPRKTSAPSSPPLRGSRSRSLASGSPAWPPGAANSPTSSPTGRA